MNDEEARLALRVLDHGKHIIADILHGVVYTPDQLQAWVNAAEAVLHAHPIHPALMAHRHHKEQ